MALTKPTVLPVWAESGDKVQPLNTEIQTGWPLSNIPPARQRFNWVLNYVMNGVLFLVRRGIADYDAAQTYEIGDKTLATDGYTYRAKVQVVGVAPQSDATKWELWAFTATQLLSKLLPISLDAPNGRVGINSPTPLVTFDANGTDALRVPRGTTGQRPTGADGYIRWNQSLNSFEGYGNGAWGGIGGGAVGGLSDKVFYENDITVNNNYTITTNKNALSAGPITIASGVTVTVPSGSVWTIV